MESTTPLSAISTISAPATPWSGIDTDAWAWADGAACTELSEDVFFAPDGGETNAERFERTARAKRVCFSCPIRVACLEQALSRGEEFGIWGGKTPAERRDLIQRQFDLLTPGQRDHIAARVSGLGAHEAAAAMGTAIATHRGNLGNARVRGGFSTIPNMLDQARTFGVQL